MLGEAGIDGPEPQIDSDPHKHDQKQPYEDRASRAQQPHRFRFVSAAAADDDSNSIPILLSHAEILFANSYNYDKGFFFFFPSVLHSLGSRSHRGLSADGAGEKMSGRSAPNRRGRVGQFCVGPPGPQD